MQPQNNQALASGDQCLGFDSNTPIWNNMYRNFQQFAVTGMKYEYVPGTIRGTELAGTNANIDGVIFASNVNSP